MRPARGVLMGLCSALFLLLFAGCDSIVSPGDPERERPANSGSPPSGAPASALGPSGTIVAWGNEALIGGPTYHLPPRGEDYVAVTAGWEHHLALTAAGTVVGWGYEGYGRMPQTRNEGYVALATGWFHSLALHEDGTISAWGVSGMPWAHEDFGQVTDTPEGDGYVALSASLWRSMALHEDGHIEVWGAADEPPPGDDFVALDAESYLALREDGSVAAFGDREVPGHLTGGGFVDIAPGVALREDGTLAAARPDAPSGDGFVAIAPGLALHEDGHVEAWGDDAHGQVSGAPDGSNFVAIASHFGGYRLAIEAAHRIVEIEIEPGDASNHIDLQSQDAIPVAVLSDSDFDAPGEVDRTSLTFGTTGRESSLRLRGRGVPSCQVQDVNGDGLDDLLCQFRAPATGFSEADGEGILRGKTVDGTGLEGRDAVHVSGRASDLARSWNSGR